MFRSRVIALSAVSTLVLALLGMENQSQAVERTFETGGHGVFFPANLGVGDPAVFPQIIGDGSGLSVYNGTPTGNEFRLDGNLVGDGWDQHFGAAQSITPGLPTDPGIVLYPYVTAKNPKQRGRRIHIMNTRVGAVWFQYDGFFTLDTNAGTLISRSTFRIVGGTRRFSRASGEVLVITTTNLADITPEGAVPFRYDFDGIINMRK